MLIPDTVSWILGTWAKEIMKWNSDRYEFLLYPVGEIREDKARFLKSIKYVDVIHCLSQSIYPEIEELLRGLPKSYILISTVHHIVTRQSIEECLSADRIMVVCKQFYNEIVSYGVPRDKLTLIYNGVDTTLFTPIDKRESKAKFDLTEQDFTIGFSAKAASDRDGRKGVDILEAVLSELSHQVVNLHVVITGPGWSEVIERIRSEYLKIHYFPFLPDESMPDYFNAIDVYIVTARVEGGPVPPLEAMSCGTPVISTPVGTILDFVHDGVNGLIVPIGNSQAVIEQILKLYQDRPLAKRLGSEGRNLILAHLQWRDTLACIDQLYGTDIYREVSPEADKRFAKDLINLNERIFQKDVARWLKKQHIKKNWIEQLKQAVLRSRA